MEGSTYKKWRRDLDKKKMADFLQKVLWLGYIALAAIAFWAFVVIYLSL